MVSVLVNGTWRGFLFLGIFTLCFRSVVTSSKPNKKTGERANLQGTWGALEKRLFIYPTKINLL